MIIPAVQQTPASKSIGARQAAATPATRSSGRKRKLIDPSTPSRSSNRHIYLYNKTIESFAFKKLPSNEEILQRLLNIITFNPEKTLNLCIKQTVKELLELWEASSIPTVDAKEVADRIAAMYKNWLKLKNDYENLKNELDQVKHVSDELRALTDQVKSQETEFARTFADLFDISHPNIQQMVTNEEDLKFLNLQRSKNRTGYISTRADTIANDAEMEIEA